MERMVGRCQCGCGAVTAIADRTDSEKGYVKGQPKRYLFGHARKPRTLGRRQAEEAAGLYRKGYTLRALAARFGVSHPVVLAALRDQGVTMRKAGGSKPRGQLGFAVDPPRLVVDPIWGKLAFLMYRQRETVHAPAPGRVGVDLGEPAGERS